MINDKLYSRGPTGEEDFPTVIYDPTNGTVSRGRVEVPYRVLE